MAVISHAGEGARAIMVPQLCTRALTGVVGRDCNGTGIREKLADGRSLSAAAERSKDRSPEALQRVLPQHGLVLEIASGAAEACRSLCTALPIATRESTYVVDLGGPVEGHCRGDSGASDETDGSSRSDCATGDASRVSLNNSAQHGLLGCHHFFGGGLTYRTERSWRVGWHQLLTGAPTRQILHQAPTPYRHRPIWS